MAKTLSYVQEHGYNTLEDAENKLAFFFRKEFLKKKFGDGKLPNLQTLKAEKEKLLVQKKEAKEKYYYYRITKKNWILFMPIFTRLQDIIIPDRHVNGNRKIYPDYNSDSLDFY